MGEIFHGKTAVVTASTRGIGLACAVRLARGGAKVFMAVRNIELAEEVILAHHLPAGTLIPVPFDAERRESYRIMAEEIARRTKRIDAIINNFGSTDPQSDGTVTSTDDTLFASIVEHNLRSVYLTCRLLIPFMTAGGAIVNISSVAAVVPDLGRTAYGTSKAAINFLTRDIAAQYASAGIRCNAVMPGIVDTDAVRSTMSEGLIGRFLKHVPLGRAGTVDDIAAAAVFLASDEASYITGTILPVAGGFGEVTPLYADAVAKK